MIRVITIIILIINLCPVFTIAQALTYPDTVVLRNGKTFAGTIIPQSGWSDLYQPVIQMPDGTYRVLDPNEVKFIQSPHFGHLKSSWVSQYGPEAEVRKQLGQDFHVGMKKKFLLQLLKGEHINLYSLKESFTRFFYQLDNGHICELDVVFVKYQEDQSSPYFLHMDKTDLNEISSFYQVPEISQSMEEVMWEEGCLSDFFHRLDIKIAASVAKKGPPMPFIKRQHGYMSIGLGYQRLRPVRPAGRMVPELKDDFMAVCIGFGRSIPLNWWNRLLAFRGELVFTTKAYTSLTSSMIEANTANEGPKDIATVSELSATTFLTVSPFGRRKLSPEFWLGGQVTGSISNIARYVPVRAQTLGDGQGMLRRIRLGNHIRVTLPIDNVSITIGRIGDPSAIVVSGHWANSSIYYAGFLFHYFH